MGNASIGPCWTNGRMRKGSGVHPCTPLGHSDQREAMALDKAIREAEDHDQTLPRASGGLIMGARTRRTPSESRVACRLLVARAQQGHVIRHSWPAADRPLTEGPSWPITHASEEIIIMAEVSGIDTDNNTIAFFPNAVARLCGNDIVVRRDEEELVRVPRTWGVTVVDDADHYRVFRNAQAVEGQNEIIIWPVGAIGAAMPVDRLPRPPWRLL